ncbi:MAG TPA: cytochrome P450 [Acidimicrobiales bacterium]|nr:cytochrome P450 [Acidimicrobiales bacterium]
MGEPQVVDFDHHSREFLDDRHAHWARMRQCPVAYSPNHGGFWVVSGHEAVTRVSRDGETFSSLYRPGAPDGIDYHGIAGVPRAKGIPPAGIAEVEGPLHQALRRVINPFMLPPAVAELKPFMEDLTNWFIDRKIESGHMDLVLDLTNPVPAVVTMRIIGLAGESWEHYAKLFHGTVAYRPGSPEYQQAIGRVPEIVSELLDEAKARRRSPRDDLLTRLVEVEVDGRRLDDQEISAVLWNLVGGGLDTTTSLTSLALHHLGGHPEKRQRLIDHPELMVPATEEFLRYFSVNETLTRTVTQDVELGGQQLKRGDVVLISWLSANHDEAEFDRPGEVVLDRSPNRHLAFGVGAHRCIGMHLARTMFQIVASAVLRRLPDYRIDEQATRFYEGNPMLAGVVSMPATFTPGPLEGPAERPF